VDAVSRYFDRVLEAPLKDFIELVGGVYPERARQLGQRTAELHLALAQDEAGGPFAPEPFTTLHQRGLYQAMRTSTGRMLRELKRGVSLLRPEDESLVREVTASHSRILEQFAPLLPRKIEAEKIRIHGDFHLGQVLNTGKDFVIVDFEGEPRRALGERRLKRASLVDVAAMLRSFDYVVAVALRRRPATDAVRLAGWAARWVTKVGCEYIDAYLEAAKGASFLPQDPAEIKMLLRIFLLEKAIYEVGYELSYRPDWIGIPLRAVLALCGAPPEATSGAHPHSLLPDAAAAVA
jgi:maltose alpha-D-glucosyltransferase/alpha-amylase